LERLLKYRLYVGQVSHFEEVYPGEQEAIVELAAWDRPTRGSQRAEWGMSCNGIFPAPGAWKSSESGPRSAGANRRAPRITRLLALALKFAELIRSGVVSNYAALAQLAQVSRSRITQMTGLLNLAPDIQEEILFLRSEEAQQFRISEPSVRRLSATMLWSRQREHWRSLRPSTPNRADSTETGTHIV